MNSLPEIRRVDDLGRVVIPKVMRQTLEINEGDNMEIYCDLQNKQVIIKQKVNKDDDENKFKRLMIKQSKMLNELLSDINEILEFEDTIDIKTLKEIKNRIETAYLLTHKL